MKRMHGLSCFWSIGPEVEVRQGIIVMRLICGRPYWAGRFLFASMQTFESENAVDMRV